jgi:hypothetical protein
MILAVIDFLDKFPSPFPLETSADTEKLVQSMVPIHSNDENCQVPEDSTVRVDEIKQGSRFNIMKVSLYYTCISVKSNW